jgi:poly(3-hydroxyalkanoate) depolymerase
MSAGDRERTHTIAAWGRALHVAERRGNPERTPLVLCNGLGSSLELFDPFVAHLDPMRPVIRFDVPGIGGSAPPVVPYRFPCLAMTLRSALDRLGYGPVDMLGVSWGGGLAQQFAFQYPRACRRLVLASTSTGWLSVPARPWVLAHLVSPGRHRNPEHAVRIAGRVYGGTARRSPVETIEALHAGRHAPSIRGYIYQLAAMAGWTSLPFLPLIRQRMLLLAGTDDPIIPPVNAAIMARLLPHATVHHYDGGHLALLTDGAGLAPVVDAFLDEP